MPEFRALLDGYRRFRSGPYSDQRARYDALANQGQSPKVMVIACSDSRVDPTIVFDAEPGQMFVVRNVANLVPPYEPAGGQHGASAAIEYAVTQLEVHHIVVFGHGMCGGIQASLSGAFDEAAIGEGKFIGRWMSMIRPARDQVRAAAALSPDIDAQRALEQAAIRLSLANLMSFPFVAERVEDGRLKLQGAHFAITEGLLRVLDPVTDRFEAVELDWRAS
ncbi:MAG: carbonic anhydrase [Alphaproteobacteria bacterium]|nr:carbonic anhydrase [Alphaproteobacteria bacterium]